MTNLALYGAKEEFGPKNNNPANIHGPVLKTVKGWIHKGGSQEDPTAGTRAGSRITKVYPQEKR